jgi:hypothetical protein
MLVLDCYLSFLYRMEYALFWAEIFMLGFRWHVILVVIFIEFSEIWEYMLLLYAFVNTCLVKLISDVVC